MKRFFTICFLGLFVITNQIFAQYSTNWERCSRTGALSGKPSWFGAGLERGIAYGTVNSNNRLYVLSRSTTPPQIRVLDPATGNDVTLGLPFDLTSVSGGTFTANDIEISSDGAVFVGNMASSAFILYVWTTEGGAPTAYNFTLPAVTGIRYGDKVSIVGSWAAGTIEVWVPGAGISATGAVQVLKTTNQGANWTTTQITLSGTYTSTVASATVAPFAPGGNFYIAGNGANPRQYDNTGAYVASSLFSGTNSSIATVKYFTSGGRNYIVTVAYRPEGTSTGNRNTRSYIYDVTTASSVTNYGVTSLLSDVDVANASNGDVAIKDNGNGTVTLFVLGTDQGVAAYSTNVAPLPVELTFFTAVAQGKKVVLNWVTTTETNNAGFSIERKFVGSEWQAVGFVNGMGTSNCTHSYAYSDNVASGHYTYRLKQIDRDGRFEYGPVVEATVALTATDYALQQNYPNPFNPITAIEYSIPVMGFTSLKIYNTLGAEVATLVSGIITSGITHKATFDAGNLPSGLYYYTIRSGNFVDTKKMMLLK